MTSLPLPSHLPQLLKVEGDLLSRCPIYSCLKKLQRLLQATDYAKAKKLRKVCPLKELLFETLLSRWFPHNSWGSDPVLVDHVKMGFFKNCFSLKGPPQAHVFQLLVLSWSWGARTFGAIGPSGKVGHWGDSSAWL